MSGITPADKPRLPRGVRLHFDKARDGHVLLAPERAFHVDANAVAVLELIDGTRTVAEIVDMLAARYGEARSVIEPDVVAMLDDLAAKRVVER
jgi:pyrroloquinoline quinone biosynthesis protein D